MISESIRWKKELARYAADLRRIKALKRIGSAARARLEQRCMIGFYIVRKLTGAFQPTNIKDVSIPIFQYKRTGDTFDSWYWPEISKFFDMDKPAVESINLNDLCNEFIHSRIFTPCLDLTGLCGVFVVSEKNQEERLLCVDIDEVIEIFDKIARGRKYYLRIGPVQRGFRVIGYRRPRKRRF